MDRDRAAARTEEAELSAVLERLVRVLRQVRGGEPLSASAASLLARLERDGPQGVSELARQEGASQPGMTQLVARLEREGFIQRRGGAEDRRVVEVGITADGRKLLASRRSQRAKALRRLLDELPEDDRAAIRAALPALAHLADVPSLASANR